MYPPSPHPTIPNNNQYISISKSMKNKQTNKNSRNKQLKTFKPVECNIFSYNVNE